METKEELKSDEYYLKLFVAELSEAEIKNILMGCANQTVIPSGLFSNATSADINNAFRGCSSLTLKEGSPIYREFLNGSRNNDKKR